VIFAVFYVW